MRDPKIILTDLFRMTKPGVTVTVTSRIFLQTGRYGRDAESQRTDTNKVFTHRNARQYIFITHGFLNVSDSEYRSFCEIAMAVRTQYAQMGMIRGGVTYGRRDHIRDPQTLVITSHTEALYSISLV